MIPLVVVEAHNHALEHIHSALRRRALTDWTMLHFDAHPDLACPRTVSARACFQPRRDEPDLYELLDSTASGIAEWIIPLILAASLKTIHWIRPKGLVCDAFTSGKHTFSVGAWQSTKVDSFLDLEENVAIKVDLPTPYYTQDDSFAPPCELQLSQQVGLHVLDHFEDSTTLSEPWLLDICLDYFVCDNPFMADIERENSDLAYSLQAAIQQSTVFRTDNSSCREIETFHGLWHDAVGQLPDIDASLVDAMTVFYESRTCLEALLCDVQRSVSTPPSPSLSKAVREAIPNLTLPHRVRNQAKLPRFRRDNPPFLITIARSTADGFTPIEVVEPLQADVLRWVHAEYCGCGRSKLEPGIVSGCCLNVCFDYGRWEGSHLTSSSAEPL